MFIYCVFLHILKSVDAFFFLVKCLDITFALSCRDTSKLKLIPFSFVCSSIEVVRKEQDIKSRDFNVLTYILVNVAVRCSV